nr:DNA-processing protein DprA [bacterium]
MDYGREQLCTMWLMAVEGIGPRLYRRVMEGMGSAQAVYSKPAAAASFLPAKAAHAVAQADKNLDAVPEGLYRCGAHAVFLEDKGYPALLSGIFDPPPVLYIRGRIQAFMQDVPRVAMVGARICTRYGREAAHLLASGVAASGVQVVSGGARGIDSNAHQGALDGGGSTLAVLGCGVDVVYPPENAALFEKIIANGALVSEYAPGIPPLREHFPGRNRVISGLCGAVVMVEGRYKSGAMITVGYAMDEGREVLAVPGMITSLYSEGPHELIANGAVPVFKAEDILDAVGVQSKTKQEPVPQQMAFRELTEAEKSVVTALQQGDMSHDELSAAVGFPPNRLNSLLTTMALDGIIKQLPGNRYGI